MYAVTAFAADAEYVTVTAYTLTKNETGGNSYPWIGALQAPVKIGDCAVSRDLYRKGWTQNKKIKIGNHICTINDLMPTRKKRWIDMVSPTKKEAFKFGKKRIIVTLMDDEVTSDTLYTENANEKENKQHKEETD